MSGNGMGRHRQSFPSRHTEDKQNPPDLEVRSLRILFRNRRTTRPQDNARPGCTKALSLYRRIGYICLRRRAQCNIRSLASP
jgi:hypothetical protein